MSEQNTPSKRVTLAEVAKLAGVSQMTASKVMRETGSISGPTHEKVKQAANQLGYVPNRLAGSLRSKSSDIVAVVLPSINDSIFGDVVSGINSVLRPKGYITFIGETQLESQSEEDMLRTVLSLHPAGLILTGGIARSENATQMLQSWRCPTIQIWGDSASRVDGTVGPNHKDAGSLVANHFCERGITAPAYIGAELQKDLCAAERFEAYRSALRSRGISINAIVEDAMPRQWETGRVLAERLMRDHPETDAIYCLNDAIGLGALSWLHQEGFDVPERVAVAGFNGTSWINAVRTRLTTVNVPRYELGQMAATSLTDLLDGKRIASTSQLPAELIYGNTT
ncbi:LacI family DNA-binding transcriptional regulator [Tateyamaria sp. ANG-S1]|uniref:LacI family DNA-binding transcriptional regulator n=1 Tax=Tateyamaria sp. ANG-S1 TaxID=1577905 RepID=UPI00057FA33B|nr:LacI family DNA-binding transcriptional regulator [Tateyamaria sp. ANG-S1]KIC49530.1 LacI family transcriptional regulator [Tateyamaria sp. ANG-S1]